MREVGLDVDKDRAKHRQLLLKQFLCHDTHWQLGGLEKVKQKVCVEASVKKQHQPKKTLHRK